MSRNVVILSIAACYFIFAILLNSVGTVILQSINSFDVSKTEASTLEGFKDLSIAIVSFLVASVIPRVGYKIAMLLALVLVTSMCFALPSLNSFPATQLLFACIGTAFALIKVSVYSIVGLLSDDAQSHSSLLNTIEGIFMVGMLSGYWLFGLFIDPLNPSSSGWLQVYYVLAAMSLVTAVLVSLAPIPRAALHQEKTSIIQEFIAMLKLAYQPLVLIFVLSIFLYVLIEQGIGTWLPTFNAQVLHLPVDVSIQLTSVFAGAIAIGRLLSGQLLKYINWYLLLNICLVGMAILVTVSLSIPEVDAEHVKSVLDVPLAAFLLPLIGLLMAPIYPVVNSVMLSALDKSRQAAMTGLIVVFSALGGTTGSILTGSVFEALGGKSAFYFSLVPMVMIATSLFFFRRFTRRLDALKQGDK